MRSDEAVARSPADWLAVAGLALCLAGSSIYLPYPLRPFHWGLALFAAALVVSPPWREAAWNSRLRLPLIVLVLLLVAQPLWIEAPDRYGRYATYLLIGALSALLGETLVRRQRSFLFLLPWLLAYWFITAYFPVFDAWTQAQRFRPRYLLTGGVWDNINDMATVLVFVNLIWLLCRRRLSLPLFGACWFYALLLNRRADLAATLVLGLTCLIWFMEGEKLRQRLKMLAVWAIATLAAISLQTEPLHLVSIPRIQPTAPTPVPAAGSPPADLPTTVPTQAGAITSRSAVPPAVDPASAAPSAAAGNAGATTVTAAPDLGLQISPQPPHAPAAQVRIQARDGDESTAFRARLTMDMLQEWRTMPWWQWFTGLGAGQLNLIWPGNKAPWASPHFFWLEMFFHVGLLWFVLLGWLMLRLDWRGRVCLLVAGIAGIAPSSMVYFQPFWLLLGVLLASVPPRSAPVSPQTARSH